MSSKFPGGLITKSPAATVGPSGDYSDGGSAPGIWSLDQAMALRKAGTWPARTKDKFLWTWGLNTPNAQLGDNTAINRSSPVLIGTSTIWAQIAAGTSHSLAIKTDGTMWAWGLNTNGPLGDNTVVLKSSPIQVGALTTWSKIAGGDYHAAAIKTNGTLWTWGRSLYGVLGDDSNAVSRSSPIQVGALTTWSNIATSNSNIHNLAIKTDGTMWAWGNDTDGNTGDNAATSRSSPVQIGALTTWSKISTGSSFSAAIKTDGTMWAWGLGTSGQIGDNTVISRSSPIQVGSLSTWSSISSGERHTLAIKTDGTLWTWGYNLYGQIGDTTVTSKSSPTQVGILTTWSKVACGIRHSIAIKTDGTLWGWGYNAFGGLGQNDVLQRSSPVQIGAQLFGWSQFTGGENHSVAIKTNGTLWAWGFNSNGGMLGLNDTAHRSSPVQVGTGTTWSKVSSSGSNTVASVNLAIKTDGSMWAWGIAPNGALGLNDIDNRSSPVQIGALTTWSQAAAGGYHAAAIKTDGTLWTWGREFAGSLGTNDVANVHRSSPVQVGALTAWSLISAGAYHHNLSIKTDGTLWAWGSNASSGKLGNNTGTSRSSPVQIGALTTWSKISAGYNHSAAIKTDGTMWTWGNGNNGRLGDGTGISRSSPIQVGALTTWTSVAAGQEFTVAAKTDGTLWTFGYNLNGQLGVDNRTAVNSPVQVGSLLNWSTVAAGGFHSMAVDTLGVLYLAGRNSYGGLGDNSIIPRSSPVQVGFAAAAETASWAAIAGSGVHTMAIAAV